MIDWFVSKVTMSFAVSSLIILSFVFFSTVIHEDRLTNDALQDVADEIANKINQALSFPGMVRYNATYQEDPSTTGLHLPIRINAKNYDLLFTRGSVTLSLGSERRTAHFSNQVHLFGPGELPEERITSGGLWTLDGRHLTLRTVSGNDFVVENIPKVIDGKFTYVTLAYVVISV